MRIPFTSLSLSALAVGLMLMPEALQQVLYLNTGEGIGWTLITGHWIHADASHLGWNVAALLVLGNLIEQHSRRLLTAALVAGMLGVNLLLLSPLSDIQYYCGLSGVLNTLLLVALYTVWQRSRHPVLWLIAVLSLVKTAIEIVRNDALITNISVAPYPLSHLAGLLAGLLVTSVAFGMSYGGGKAVIPKPTQHCLKRKPA